MYPDSDGVEKPGKAAKTGDKSPWISENLERVIQNLEHVEFGLATLSNRLSPVTSPLEPTLAQDDSEKKVATVSPIASKLEDIAIHLGDIADRQKALIRRLEI